jgi:hypothetical protein
MGSPPPLVFEQPGWLIAAALVGIAILLIGRGRKIRLGRSSIACGCIGLLFLVLAAGSPIWRYPKHQSIAVLVDLSPSTRGATFRDQSALLNRVHQLLGTQPYQLYKFSDHTEPLNEPLPSTLTDLPCDQTHFDPPPTDAIVLFTDGQFPLPAYAPPTFPVIDPALDHPADAAVTDLVSLGNQLLATIRNNSSPRPLHWSNAIAIAPAPSTPPPAGNFTQQATKTVPGTVSVSLSSGDRWPENDALSFASPPPKSQERWWIGQAAPVGWQQMPPAALPTEPGDYLNPSVIVLNNIPADDFSSRQLQLLLQYVRDLGGNLLIVGGDRAFAAGNYPGTTLEDLSPLASSPPAPNMQWILLVDSSGSMANSMAGLTASDGSGTTPWSIETRAITQLLPLLPPHDALSIGSFAESLQWWSTGKSAGDTLQQPLPPATAAPSGPTNLAAALHSVAAAANGSMPSQLLLLTDADTTIPDPSAISAALSAGKIHLHLLAIGNGSALPDLKSIAAQTGGSVITQFDPHEWISSAKLLLQSALPQRYEHRPLTIAPPPTTINEWNQTWLKPSASELQQSDQIVAAAQWQQGLGKVIAIAYPAAAAQIQALAEKNAAVIEDPKFSVTWSTASEFKIQVRAIDQDRFLNGEPLSAQILDPQINSQPMQTFDFTQTGPGEYELNLPTPRTSRWVIIRDRGNPIKRFAVAGRYPIEFNAIGNNLQNLQTLADRTAGQIIPPGPVQPIDFHWPSERKPLQSEFAIAGFTFISLGLVLNRRLQK